MTAPPLIVHVIHRLAIGGMENGLVNLINRIPTDRYRHTVVCIEDFSDFRNRILRPDVEVIALHRSTKTQFGLYRSLYALFRQQQPAILHSRNFSGLDALLPAALARVPHRIHGEHGWDVGDLTGTNRKFQRLRKLHSPLVHRYISVSKDLERYLVDRVGIAQSRISQIYNGVDCDRFAPVPCKPVGLMPASFYVDGALVIGTVGRLQLVKDQATLIRAFALLRHREPQYAPRLRLMLVGDGVVRDTLVALAAAEGVAEVTWFAGKSEDVRPHYGCIDVFVLPSLMEGISNTVLEAMASALPIVASSVGGNVELVQHGVNGYLIAPSDASSLAATLAQYLDDPALRHAHGAASRRRAIDAFSIDAMVSGYVNVYDSMLSPLRRPASS